jgi:hypothetical protein
LPETAFAGHPPWNRHREPARRAVPWSRTERLSTLTAHADYDEDDERFTLQARLVARDDAPRAMEARVEYRIRYWGSNSRRFTQEYVWREQVEF